MYHLQYSIHSSQPIVKPKKNMSMQNELKNVYEITQETYADDNDFKVMKLCNIPIARF